MTCPNCQGRGWVTPNIKQYPGDRVACSQCAPTPPPTPTEEEARAIHYARLYFEGVVGCPRCSSCAANAKEWLDRFSKLKAANPLAQVKA